MKILISTWGNPYGWEEVEYCYKSKCEKAKDPSKLIKEKEDITKTLIISVDTLSDESIKCFNDWNYENIKKSAETIIRNFYKDHFKEEPDKVIISYGVGEFNNSKFTGSAMDFYFYVFKELSFTFTEWLEKNNCSSTLEVYLDISHGINFLPVLTYRALKEMLQMLAYTYKVKLIVLNSDTFIRSAKPSFLNINEIENSNLYPRVIGYKSDRRLIEPFYHLEENQKKNIGQILSKDNFSVDDEVFCFLSAFMYGLPVFVINYLPNYDELKGKIEKALNKFEENIQVEREGKLKIIRKIEFTINFENLLKAYMLSWLLNKGGFRKKEEIELEEIKEIKNKIWREENFPVECNRIDKEIYDVNNLRNIEEGYKTYAELVGKSTGNNIDKRNFFAHAGFEHNIIEIKKDNGNIKLRIYSKLEYHAKCYLKDSLPRG